MHVLFVSWEVAPFFKVGGLGDIARSLPKALSSLDVDIRLITPLYEKINLYGQKKHKVCDFLLDYDDKKITITIYQIKFLENDIPIYLLDKPGGFDPSSKIKDTFAIFDLAVVKIIQDNILSWKPEIVHCNDHHAGFIPFLIKHNNLPVKTLLTIHNLYFQGKISLEYIKKMHVENTKCSILQLECQKQQINFLLEGITHADLVNTVSETYAKEILTEEYGCGLENVLRDQSSRLSGILNGLDYEFKKPSTDELIPYHFNDHIIGTTEPKNVYPYKEGKRLNKLFLQTKFRLKVDGAIPLIGFIGRFAPRQKGLELIYDMLKRLDISQYQFVLLGAGDKEWEKRFLEFSKKHPKNVFCSVDFDEEVASEIYASCDFMMIPSGFEPCGLVQMIAMKYGTVPIARATGGLKDSITDHVDGFLFTKFSSDELEETVKRAVELRKNHPDRFSKMIEAAMAKDFSWHSSAKKYLQLYKKLV